LDPSYQEKGATLKPDIYPESDILLKVQPPTPSEARRIKEGSCYIGFLQPYGNPEVIRILADRKISAFSMELMPRISRAQPMDALSAMSTVAGYKAVLIAAGHLPKFFPLLMTAAGTLAAARVLILGAGVAGLQAIGTARRLGAIVEAYDTRPVVKEQVESLGGRFVDLGLEAKDAQDKGGYAKAQSEDFYRRQQEALGRVMANCDAVITTALIPGKRAPVLITEEAVKGMRPGSVIVDLAAEAGGNCALTESGKEVVKHGVTISGLLNLPSTMPYHASMMYARNVTSFLLHLVKEGKVNIDLADELTRGPLVTREGEIVNEAVKGALAGAKT
jgi:NAD(P) transhydrogenase subunit alpha